MKIRIRFWWWVIIGTLLFSLLGVKAQPPSRVHADVMTLVGLGPRVAGTPTIQKARDYLLAEYRESGYVTEVGTFTYPKFLDNGSNLLVNNAQLDGRALAGSRAGKLQAPLIGVPGVGKPDEFAAVNVKNAIAIVRRGEIRFLDKARNAQNAGAVGLVIVNTSSGELAGTLGGEVNIPVFSLSGERGEPLLKKALASRLEATLNVNTQGGNVTGYNAIAHKPGVKSPRILIGGHYDSVLGSPGANDNASGTAVVLELARRLANTPLANQIWFVAFDGEEDGLHGSKAFVNSASPEFLKGLQAMLNFDMVGVNEKLLVGGTSELTALATKADPKISTFRDTGSSDHQSFTSAGVPAIFFYRGQDPNYHSPNDTQVDPKLLEATVEAANRIIQERLAQN
ncbi:M28 family metallopeptidase [Funiculus sociatus GB2-A5]|uniref:M28 family metallopeptidase n=1 Tax=Funiculus sociatus GB2-A5 TaxID=2933946 RepID=A0ABV0JPU8_9CYAN|nr:MULTISPECIES: M28 family metallopeptidase [unclassified Trichocoleus]MBD1908046.1 M28 family peptidase [Trichocoleus sp. FACHB-832]MBD2061602.1 M28 family peptidase [Trichocoleus sp. FACHB-6]